MYDYPKIDIFEFGAVTYVVEVIYCFETMSDYCDLLFFEINLN